MVAFETMDEFTDNSNCFKIWTSFKMLECLT